MKRDLQARFAGSIFGTLWVLIQPLWQLVLFSFVFSTVMKMKVSRLTENTESFSIFLFAGLLPWLAFHEGLFRGITSVTENAALVKKLRFPSELLILTTVTAAVVQQVLGTVVFALILAMMGELSYSTLPLLFVAFPLQIALTWGLACLLASLHVFLRDTAQVAGLVLTGWFYFTPIVYPLSLLDREGGVEWAQWLALNPITALVELHRAALLGGTPWVLGWPTLVISALLFFLGGRWVFKRLAPAFVDEI